METTGTGRTALEGHRPSASAADPSGSRLRRLLRHVGTAALVLLVLQLPVRLWVAEPLEVRTVSMAPTLQPGERVLTWKPGAHGRTWHPGDIVSFGHQGQIWVKRVVAVGGDTVGLVDGRLVVDGHTVREPWADPVLIDSVFFGPETVPTGTVFVMGDNRRNSDDSRTFGPVRTTDITGRVVAVVWPLPAAGRTSSTHQ